MKLVFFGSPQIAVAFLEACVSAPGWEVSAVVAQPDRPSGRGMILRPPPVAEAAARMGIALRQPVKPAEFSAELRALSPDLCVVVAYGHILRREILNLARLGFLNVHFSLLPRYRGAAPVQWSLVRGDAKTGVSLFWLDDGMDTGPLQSVAEIPVDDEESAPELFQRLAALGVNTLRETLAEIAAGRIRRVPQTGDPSKAPKIKPEFGRLSFEMPAKDLHNRVRGLRAGPGCFLMLELPGAAKPQRVKVLNTGLERAADEPLPSETVPPGAVLCVDPKKGILVQLNPGRLWFREVQPEGKKQQTSADFLNGLRLGAGDRLVSVS